MFRPNWPSSGVRVVKVKDSAAHCNVVFFPPILKQELGVFNNQEALVHH
jgi:hypothetical protein